MTWSCVLRQVNRRKQKKKRRKKEKQRGRRRRNEEKKKVLSVEPCPTGCLVRNRYVPHCWLVSKTSLLVIWWWRSSSEGGYWLSVLITHTHTHTHPVPVIMNPVGDRSSRLLIFVSRHFNYMFVYCVVAFWLVPSAGGSSIALNHKSGKCNKKRSIRLSVRTGRLLPALKLQDQSKFTGIESNWNENWTTADENYHLISFKKKEKKEIIITIFFLIFLKEKKIFSWDETWNWIRIGSKMETTVGRLTVRHVGR